MPTLPGLVSNLALNSSSNATDIVGRKASGKGAVRARKGFTLFLLNKDMDDIIKIVLSLEKSGPIIDGASETVKPETKKTNKQESGFLPLLALFLVMKAISRRQYNKMDHVDKKF